MSQEHKRGRTLGVTVKDLLQSKRLEIAVANFKDDPMLLYAIFIELGMEAERVAKYAVIKKWRRYNSLPVHDLQMVLNKVGVITSESDEYSKKSENEMNNYSIFWNMTELEQKLYMADPKMKLSPEERSKLLKEVKEKLGIK